MFEDIHVDVHHHKVEEDLDAPRLPRRANDFPFQVERVWVEQTQRTVIVGVAGAREDLVEQDRVAVFFVDVDSRMTRRQLTQPVGLNTVDVDKVELVEWWLNEQRVQRA